MYALVARRGSRKRASLALHLDSLAKILISMHVMVLKRINTIVPKPWLVTQGSATPWGLLNWTSHIAKNQNFCEMNS